MMPYLNKEHKKKNGQKYYKNNKSKHNLWNLKRKYRITLEDWNNLFNKQNGCCACCEKHQSELSKNLCVDHIEEPVFKIRGLLCNECNFGIGKLGDDLEGIMKAVNYLKNAELV